MPQGAAPCCRRAPLCSPRACTPSRFLYSAPPSAAAAMPPEQSR